MILDGKALAKEIHAEIAAELAPVPIEERPKLVAVLVGDDAASQIYVNSKMRACKKVGMPSEKLELPASLSQEALLEHIERLNADPSVYGILVQLPLPQHLNALVVAQAIAPDKDVDGVHPVNYGKLLMGEPSAFVPCTPLGIQVMLERNNVDIQGRHVVIAGRSNIVGKPLACLLVQKGKNANATVTVVHSRTKNLAAFSREADILVAAIGQPEFFTADMVGEGAVVIDVGQNRIDDPATPRGYRLVGDVAYDEVAEKASLITPVPGGVGPMTIAMLLSNTLTAFRRYA